MRTTHWRHLLVIGVVMSVALIALYIWSSDRGDDKLAPSTMVGIGGLETSGKPSSTRRIGSERQHTGNIDSQAAHIQSKARESQQIDENQNTASAGEPQEQIDSNVLLKLLSGKRIPPTTEHSDYADYDTTLVSPDGRIPATLIGITIDISELEETYSFQPTPEDAALLAKMEKQGELLIAQGRMEEAYELDAQLVAIHERNVRPGGVLVTRRIGGGGRELADGTRIEYFRQDNGALIRRVTQPDGSSQEYTVNWASDILQGREKLPWSEVSNWR